MSYLRSVYLHKDKSVFKVDDLPVERFAESLGLPGAPKIKFLSKEAVKRRKNASRTVEAAEADVMEEKEASNSKIRTTADSEESNSEDDDVSGESGSEGDSSSAGENDGGKDGEDLPVTSENTKKVRFKPFKSSPPPHLSYKSP